MQKIITILALLALVGPARAQQAPPAPQVPEAEPIVLHKGHIMQGIDIEALLEEYSELTGKKRKENGCKFKLQLHWTEGEQCRLN